PNHGDLMKRSPTKRNENIITRPLLLKIILMGTYVSILFLCQYLFNYLGAAPKEKLTVLFTMFVLMQLFNSFNCRELHSESILKNLLSNKIMLCVVGTTFVLQVIFIQFAGAFFGTVPLPLNMWLKLFALSFTVIIVSESVKFVMRAMQRREKSAL
ncbi:MAG: cation transporting ATPase C-terminal domain-containing protein, partial [Synergistes sp.]|nr:cation transporting ATPase C-terminal domain-containing protein [Synergistes sp.]